MRLQNHPFQFLLRFEWCLLTIAVLGELIQIPPFRVPRGIPHEPGWNLAIVLIFVLTSLRLRSPNLRRYSAVFYGALLVGLLAIAAFGTGFRLLPLLCIVVVLRCGVMFEAKISWVLAAVTFLMGAGAQIYTITNFRLPRLEQIALRRAVRLVPDISPGLLRTEVNELVVSRLLTTTLSSILLLGLVLLFVQVLLGTLLAERRSRNALAGANTKLRDYALRVETLATLQERNRISREIHDSLGHSLTAFNLHLAAALRLLKSDPVEAEDLLKEAKRIGSETLRSVRESVSSLRSEDPLKSQPLTIALELLLQDWSRSTQIFPTCEIDAILANSLPESLRVGIYRIVQEALTNIAKYAQAKAVKIGLERSGLDVRLFIQDDGIGFVRSQTQSGFGLQGMEERSLALNGVLTITTAIGKGCRIEVLFSNPVQPRL
ncbi:MAG: sensor histidine kinase [Alkalinema sp. CAN_BIN05]|nr:sensor histidine kinase [Alkalinema sp. CAN_BIN05]